MPDEVVTETPTTDALSGAETPPAAEATPVETPQGVGEAEAPGGAPPPDKSKDPAVIELARKLAREGNLPEHQALRAERREFKQRVQAFEQRSGAIEQRNAALEAELREAEANPFAWAAKRRGVTEADVYNERTLRSIDPRTAELEDIKKTVEQERAERKRERDEQAAREAQAYQARIEQTFASEVIHIATTEREYRYIQLGLEDGEYKPQNVAAEVLRRVQAAYAEAEQEEQGSGKILDPKEVLRTIETELREEAKRKAARLAKLEAAGQPAIPDREGAVEPATHEATRNSGPRTLTNALASQTSGQKRKLTHRERMIEAEKRLRGA